MSETKTYWTLSATLRPRRRRLTMPMPNYPAGRDASGLWWTTFATERAAWKEALKQARGMLRTADQWKRQEQRKRSQALAVTRDANWALRTLPRNAGARS